jgi:hypothetical protein
VYDLMLALVAARLIMPMWLNAMAFSAALTIPNVTVEKFLWHGVYGTALGGVSPTSANR